MSDRSNLFKIIGSTGQTVDIGLVEKAIDLAEFYHKDQSRASGEPYITHPIAVAEIIAEMNLDTASIVTAILHDTVEDTKLSIDEIEKIFGKEIAHLVFGVTKLTRLEFKSDQIKQAENFRKLLLAMSEDIRVLLVKLADRLHNMRTIDYVQSQVKKQKISLETMEIYAPLAERIGMHQCKTELQDIAFRILYPSVRESILHRLNEIAEDGGELIDQIIAEISAHMQDAGVEAKVSGRQKTPYSIWMKMNQKNVGFDQLSDIIAFRVVVSETFACYKALGVIHGKYKMIPDNFQDFISTPKNNGYQSIHTIVIGPMQQRIEIQIRTEEMHKIAEYGVAAHWRYKQKYTAPDGKQFKWIRELLHILDHARDPEEFISNTKLEMYYDQVFCFTPKGKLIALPKGATPVDFAYSVHSEIGFHCVGVKINGKIAPLRAELKNGDQIEILTNKTQTPSRDWVEFAITGKALSEIKKYIRQRSIEQYLSLGKDMLKKGLKAAGLSLEQVDLKIAVSKFNKNSVDELYCVIGEGMINPDEVIKIFKPANSSLADKFALFRLPRSNSKDHEISIKGLIPGMAIHYAGCCNPIPGDKIIGVVHTGKGITIHSVGCEYLDHLHKNNFSLLPLNWGEEGEEKLFVARVVAKISNQPKGLAVLSAEIAKEKCNIANFKITSRNSDFFDVLIDLEVNNLNHLENILATLRSKHEIIYIERYQS